MLVALSIAGVAMAVIAVVASGVVTSLRPFVGPLCVIGLICLAAYVYLGKAPVDGSAGTLQRAPDEFYVRRLEWTPFAVVFGLMVAGLVALMRR